MLPAEIHQRIGNNAEVPSRIRDADHAECERQYQEFMARGGAVTVVPRGATNRFWEYNNAGPLNAAKYRSQSWAAGRQNVEDVAQ